MLFLRCPLVRVILASLVQMTMQEIIQKPKFMKNRADCAANSWYDATVKQSITLVILADASKSGEPRNPSNNIVGIPSDPVHNKYCTFAKEDFDMRKKMQTRRSIAMLEDTNQSMIAKSYEVIKVKTQLPLTEAIVNRIELIACAKQNKSTSL